MEARRVETRLRGSIHDSPAGSAGNAQPRQGIPHRSRMLLWEVRREGSYSERGARLALRSRSIWTKRRRTWPQSWAAEGVNLPLPVPIPILVARAAPFQTAIPIL